MHSPLSVGEQRASVWPTDPAATALFWPLRLRGAGLRAGRPCGASFPTTLTGPCLSPVPPAIDCHGYHTSPGSLCVTFWVYLLNI